MNERNALTLSNCGHLDVDPLSGSFTTGKECRIMSKFDPSFDAKMNQVGSNGSVHR